MSKRKQHAPEFLAPGSHDPGLGLELVGPPGGGDHDPRRHLGPVVGDVARLRPRHQLRQRRMRLCRHARD